MATLRRSFPTFLRTFIHHRRYAQQPPATLNSTVVSGKIPGGSSEHGTTQEISAKSTNAQNSLKNMSETSNPRKSPFDSLGMSLNAPLTGERSMIDGLGPTTFTISGVRVKGSVLIMPTYSTLWKIDEWTDLCPAAFTLVKVSLPRPDIVVLGTGASILVSFIIWSVCMLPFSR